MQSIFVIDHRPPHDPQDEGRGPAVHEEYGSQDNRAAAAGAYAAAGAHVIRAVRDLLAAR